MNKQILICGPLAKSQMTGVALAVELLVCGLKAARIDFKYVDMTFMDRDLKSGTFSILRAVENIMVIVLCWGALFRSQTYYSIMSTSTLGFIRDYLTVGFAHLLGRRTILHLHGGGFEFFYTAQKPWLQRMIRANLKRTDTIIVLGELLKEQFYCAGEFVKKKLVVVPNGLTLGVAEPSIGCKSLSDDEPVQLLYLSSLMPSKGFIDVLQAFSLLEKERPGKMHLHLCGNFVDALTERHADIFDEETLMGFIRVNDLESSVTYHRQVLGEAKDKRFSLAHVFLLPTNYPWEGQPLSIIEALAYATPVISCKHKGVPELVSERQSGYLVKPGDSIEIADAVRDIVSDKENYKAMSRAARRHYESNFRREQHLKKLLAVILDCSESAIPSMNI